MNPPDAWRFDREQYPVTLRKGTHGVLVDIGFDDAQELSARAILAVKLLLGACSPEVVEYLNKKIKLDERTAAATQSPLSF